MECLGNFLVKVSIDLKCFGLEYPGKAVTDLQISAVDSKDADNSNTCLAFADGDSGNNHLYRYDFYTKVSLPLVNTFFSNLELTSPVSATSDILYFDRKVLSARLMVSLNLVT